MGGIFSILAVGAILTQFALFTKRLVLHTDPTISQFLVYNNFDTLPTLTGDQIKLNIGIGVFDQYWQTIPIDIRWYRPYAKLLTK